MQSCTDPLQEFARRGEGTKPEIGWHEEHQSDGVTTPAAAPDEARLRRRRGHEEVYGAPSGGGGRRPARRRGGRRAAPMAGRRRQGPPRRDRPSLGRHCRGESVGMACDAAAVVVARGDD